MAALADSCPGPWRPADGDASMVLLRRLQDGDETALSALIERYRERLLRVVRIRLGPPGRGLRRVLESSDILQETWKAALAGVGDLRVEGDADLLNWLARIATNEIRDQLDRMHTQRRSIEREVSLEDTSAEQQADPSPMPDARAERAELAEVLDAGLAELPEHYREVVLLRDYCGADWPTIAAKLGRESVHATQQLHQRAWIRLRRVVGPRLRN